MIDVNPDVTVLIPVYNCASTILDAINSVLSQEGIVFEIIIVDDGSTDETSKLINSITDSRVYYYYQENRGISAALNYGISLAKSEYIARLDGDDKMLPFRLKTQYDCFLKDKNIIMISSAVEYIDTNGNVIGRSFPYIFSFLSKEILKKMNIYSHPATMFKKSIVKNAGGYDISLSGICEDYHLWHKISPAGKIINLPEPYTQYRISEGQITDWFPSKEYCSLIANVIQEDIPTQESVNLIKDVKNRDKNLRTSKKNNNHVKDTRIQLIKNNKFKRVYIILQNLKINKKVASYIVCSMKSITIVLKLLLSAKRC
ncbi:glycosyltransferase [Citrobacter sp. RHBSTW-00524]|uniref:glycosyltransferase family 2 protein n=1 Tax=Citrobacter sp. RHBSTW-00524 TaxID=2742653 RepID=UPI0015E9A55D|nr:glycosyltransferase [Citrobacter sp. RHBSTW-00524]QLW40683.1 glycosyltransferase [Citrobacter sp. RHBSTW-00524]